MSRLVRTILVTAFVPFGGSRVNPSQAVLKNLQAPSHWRLEKLILPVSHRKLGDCLSKQLQDSAPDLILCLGEARGSTQFRIECQGKNLLDFQAPDNDGVVLKKTVIQAQGAQTLPSTLCRNTIFRALSLLELSAHFSQDAGAYLCNQLLYTLCYRFQESQTQVGFLHLPSLPEQNFGPGVPLSLQSEGVQAVLLALCSLQNQKRDV